jgi:multicomponent Na+:H+ antiporter subunit D
VLYRTGKINGSDLGGLYKSMPWTCGFCLVGASSISAFPLFSGFISKSMVMAAAANEGHLVIWLMLLFASAGVFHHAGIKIPFFAFFAHDQGIRCEEAPCNMLLAMGIGAVLCIAIGSFPQYLYGILPYPVEYEPYTATHVVLQVQLLFFSALAFTVLKLTNIYPPELRSVNIDVDWTYRKLLPGAARLFVKVGAPIRDGFIGWGKRQAYAAVEQMRQYHGPTGVFARTWLTSSSVLVVTIFLVVYLFLYF